MANTRYDVRRGSASGVTVENLQDKTAAEAVAEHFAKQTKQDYYVVRVDQETSYVTYLWKEKS